MSYYFTFTSTPSSISLAPLLSHSPPSPIFNFASFSSQNPRRRRQIRRVSVKSSLKLPKPSLSVQEQQNQRLNYGDDDKPSLLKCVAKPIAVALFCIAIGFCPALRGMQPPAVAAVAAEVKKRKGEEKDVVLKQKDHEYSDFTRRLLQTVSELIRRIDEARGGNGDLKAVEAALKEVKLKKEELQEEIMSGLYVELRELKGERERLVKEAEDVFEAVARAKREQEGLVRKGGGGKEAKEMIARLEKEMSLGEEKYNEVWEKVGEINDRILRRETMVLSIGVREISFIERESQALVEKFRREIRRQSNVR